MDFEDCLERAASQWGAVLDKRTLAPAPCRVRGYRLLKGNELGLGHARVILKGKYLLIYHDLYSSIRLLSTSLARITRLYLSNPYRSGSRYNENNQSASHFGKPWIRL